MVHVCVYLYSVLKKWGVAQMGCVLELLFQGKPLYTKMFLVHCTTKCSCERGFAAGLYIQARAPGANVIVVGTHLDELRRKAGGTRQADALMQKYEEQIAQEYAPTSKTSPVIQSINFVAVPDRLFGFTNIETLVESIYDVASNMEVPRSESKTCFISSLNHYNLVLCLFDNTSPSSQ